MGIALADRTRIGAASSCAAGFAIEVLAAAAVAAACDSSAADGTWEVVEADRRSSGRPWAAVAAAGAVGWRRGFECCSLATANSRTKVWATRGLE